MLVQQGQARSGNADRRLACTLAAIAGALNAAVFDAAGLFSANMTGNVSLLADRLGLADLAHAALYLALVATFVTGALLSTLLVNAGRRRRLAGIYAFSIGAEALLLALLGLADLWTTGPVHGPILAFGLSLLMGLQNAVVTRISDARVRTTHVTGMVTDIGIGLANLIDLRHPGQEAEAALNRQRLRLHTFTVASFAAGGLAGILAYRAAGPFLLLATAALLAILAIHGVLSARTQPPIPEPQAPNPHHPHPHDRNMHDPNPPSRHD